MHIRNSEGLYYTLKAKLFHIPYTLALKGTVLRDVSGRNQVHSTGHH